MTTRHNHRDSSLLQIKIRSDDECYVTVSVLKCASVHSPLLQKHTESMSIHGQIFKWNAHQIIIFINAHSTQSYYYVIIGSQVSFLFFALILLANWNSLFICIFFLGILSLLIFQESFLTSNWGSMYKITTLMEMDNLLWAGWEWTNIVLWYMKWLTKIREWKTFVGMTAYQWRFCNAECNNDISREYMWVSESKKGQQKVRMKEYL